MDTIKIIPVIALILAVATVTGKENIGSGKTAIGYKGMAATCNPASAQIDLNVNNVRATLLNGGDMWWNLNDARYEVPIVDPSTGAPSVHSLFAGAIWMGGIDAGGQLKIAAQTYRQNGNDFWPGPLDNSASVTNGICEDYDKFWKINREDIDSLINRVNAAGGCIDVSQVPKSVLEWPAKGNIYSTGATGALLTINNDLAPFFDADGNGFYNPECGDYPVINPECGGFSNVYGDQMIFWVYNDRGNIHTETGGQAIGVQVNAVAFAFATSDEINDMTFYRYKLINKATLPIRDFYMAQWVDADLGCFNNDYVGCDTTRALGICYNGTASDPDCASRGYGSDPPLVGVDFFEGPLSDPDTNGNRYKLGMSAFTYYNNDFSVTGNPETAVHYYNYMTGFWKDNTCFTGDKCNAYGGSMCTRYMFPGSPEQGPFPDFWSECSCNNLPADRRFLQSSGPFTLQPGDVNNITVGVVWVRPPSGTYPCPSFEATIATADDKAQALFDNCFKLVDGPDAPTLVIRELDKEIIISLVNLAGSNNINESYEEVDPIARAYWETNPQATDTSYRFQGYIVYQLKNGQVSVQELNDPSKARVIFQVDLKDNVDKLVNFTYDATVEADIPALKVSGENNGIRKSFQVTEDLFATGSKALINYKTYYYTAVAYAYNNYLPYNVGTGDGQKSPYLQGRRNFKRYSGIPHMWESPRGGTELQSEYGDGVIVTRLDGTGNGGWNLDLTDSSILNILNSPNSFYGPVEYEPNKGPIGVKIFDPMKVKKANFTLSLMDTIIIDTLFIRGNKDTTYLSPQATWRLDITNEDFTTNVIFAEQDISNINEQLITDYGISLSVNHCGLAGKAPDDFRAFCQGPTTIDGFIEANGFIEATIEFDNPEKQWLTGVGDDGTFGPDNWIRSGQYTGGANDECEEFYDDHKYDLSTDERQPSTFYDPNAVFGSALGGTVAPYGLAANWVNRALSTKNPPVNQCRSSYSYGPAFPYRFRLNYTPSSNFEITENDLHNLHSVDVVLTSNTDYWTRCVVVELGEDSTLTENFARKGNIRRHLSWNKDGSYASADTGASWFPGYAINVETGERLNMMFGEDSWLKGEHGNDMIWNPTSNEESPVSGSEPLFGGKHFIYVLNTRYDEGRQVQRDMLDNSNKYDRVTGTGVSNWIVCTKLNDLVYSKIMWVSTTLLQQGFKLDPAPPNGNIVPTDVKIRVRVNVPYQRFDAGGFNTAEHLPQYFFSTDGQEARTQQVEVAKTACDMMRVVPNPYYAYSAYETSQLDNRVKITNLPDNCTVTIYTLGGTLIKQFNRDIGSDVSEGASTDENNLDNSIDWNLKNNKDIPVASGVYLIHVVKDGVCEKVVKWFGVLRPTDLDTF